MTEINAIKFIIIAGPAGSGKSRLIKNCLKSILKNKENVSLYSCEYTFSDVNGKFKHYNFPAASHHNEDYLNKFKNQIVLDLQSGKTIFIDEPQILMPPTTGSDVFHIKSNSKVFLTARSLTELLVYFPFLRRNELSIIETGPDRNDVNFMEYNNNPFKYKKEWITKAILINSVKSQLRSKS